MNRRRYVPRLVALGVLVVTMSVGIALVQTRQNLQSRALVPIDYISGITYYKGAYTLKLDLCRPKSLYPAKVPGVILIHGGGWVGGERTRLTKLCQSLAGVGYVAATIDYRIATATSNHYPAQLDDIQYAVRWLRYKAATDPAGYPIDAKKIISWGESAGGNLASLLGILETRSRSMGLTQYSSKTQAVVNEFGLQDLTLETYRNNEIMSNFMKTYIGYTYEQRPDLYVAASPYHQANSTTAPFLMIGAGADTLVPVWELDRMRQRLSDLGVQTDSRVFPYGHNFIELLENKIPDASGPVRQAEFSFIRNLTAGNLCENTAKILSQNTWINNLAYSRTIPINSTTKQPDWNKASSWSGPIRPDGLIPGTGAVYTDDIAVYPSAKKLIQSFWRPEGGYSREVPIKTDGTPDWAEAGGWTNPPLSASLFPPYTGDMQVSDTVMIGRGSTLLQSYWHNNSGFIRYVATGYAGNPEWSYADEWSAPVSAAALPGTATKPITAQTSIVYPDGKTMRQTFWRGDEGYARTVPLNTMGYPDWNRANSWVNESISNLPVTQLPLTVTGISMYYSDCY